MHARAVTAHALSKQCYNLILVGWRLPNTPGAPAQTTDETMATAKTTKDTKEKKVTGAAAKRLEALKKTMPDIMDVAIDPADLETLDDEAIKELYEAKLGENRKVRGLTDLSDMMASHQAKRKSEGKPKKGEKKFKF